jgi:hypothetical protein
LWRMAAGNQAFDKTGGHIAAADKTNVFCIHS